MKNFILLCAIVCCANGCRTKFSREEECQLSDWGSCNATCGEGAIKTRNVTIPAKNGGNCSQKLVESCNLQPCPVECQLSDWGPCNATCGEGAIKTRNVTIPAKNGGNCSQKLVESCNLEPCPVDCQLSNWGQCNATCGEGAIKTRNVTVPAKNGGNCSQKLVESCNLQPCPVSTILVSPGRPSNSGQKTEVINLEDNSKCQDVGDFPLKISQAVGSYLGSFPVICGGYGESYTSLNQCHQLKSRTWQPFATLGQRRYGAAGIVHANTFIIFGGYDTTGSGYLSTTEIVTEEGQVTPGPEMPVAVLGHSIASLDEKTWIVTGGDTSTTFYADGTWFFDPVSQEFQQGPPLITGRRWHASATLQDQDTKENIVAVVGGYNGVGYLDSTEFLRNGEWSPGPQMPKKLSGFSAVVLNGDLYTIGGYQTAIHRLSCSSGNCTWTTMDQELKVARWNQVAMAVPNDLCK